LRGLRVLSVAAEAFPLIKTGEKTVSYRPARGAPCKHRVGHVEKLQPGINIAGLVGHSAVRFYVMGERAVEEQATDAERAEMAAVVARSIDRGAVGFDAVKHLLLCRIERRPARLDMTVYPYLPQASVAITSPRTYLDLLRGAAS